MDVRAYFPYGADAATFDRAFTHAVADIQKGIRAKYLPPENVLRFRHGGAWKNPGNTETLGGQMQTHSAVLETRFDALVNNDLAVLERSLNHVSEAMHRQFAEMFYSRIGEACDQSGNTIDAQAEGSLEEGFMAMLEKIEFGVDKDGRVSLPQIHVQQELGERMMATLEGTSQEYKDRVEALKARKTAEALERESERKARFVRYGPCVS